MKVTGHAARGLARPVRGRTISVGALSPWTRCGRAAGPGHDTAAGRSSAFPVMNDPVTADAANTSITHSQAQP